jgi:hypothetical protein
MAFIKEKIDIKICNEHFNATEIDHLKDSKLHKEVLYCLKYIDKHIKLFKKNKVKNYEFVMEKINPQIFRSLEFISDRLRTDGFKFEFGEIWMQEASEDITVKFTITDRFNKMALSQERLVDTIQFYKEQISLLKRPTKTISEIAHTDISKLIKMLKGFIIDENQYITRTM